MCRPEDNLEVLGLSFHQVVPGIKLSQTWQQVPLSSESSCWSFILILQKHNIDRPNILSVHVTTNPGGQSIWLHPESTKIYLSRQYLRGIILIRFYEVGRPTLNLSYTS